MAFENGSNICNIFETENVIFKGDYILSGEGEAIVVRISPDTIFNLLKLEPL